MKFFSREITQVKEAIPWVRCASGNVYCMHISIRSHTLLPEKHGTPGQGPPCLTSWLGNLTTDTQHVLSLFFYCENKNTLYNINFNHICLKGNHLILKALHVEENCEHENILYNLIFNHISLKGKHLSLK